MRHCTRQNIVNATLGLTAIELLGPNSNRKAFLLSPVAGGPLTGFGSVVAQVFQKGANQQFIVPSGVTQIVDAYVWGSGGNGAAGQAVNGGGGGGGGGFGTTGPLAVTPQTVFLVTVDPAGNAGTSSVTNPSGTVLASVSGGASGAASAGGAGGAAATGTIKFAGGAGGTASTNKGGGGGGSAGNGSVGSAGSATQTGGAAGGSNVLNGFGQGAVGGAGGAANGPGVAGTIPGSGGGGGGATTGAGSLGADGQGIVFYSPSLAQQAVSLSASKNVAVGQGTLNFLPGQTYPTVVSDADLGDIITGEWWAISGVANTPIQVTEYLYDVEPDDLGAWLKKLAGW